MNIAGIDFVVNEAVPDGKMLAVDRRGVVIFEGLLKDMPQDLRIRRIELSNEDFWAAMSQCLVEEPKK